MTDANTQLALMIDLERCTGCKSCEAACKQTNALGPNSYRNRVIWFDEQQQPSVGDTTPARLDFLTVTCQQCARPACLRACPVQPAAIEELTYTGAIGEAGDFSFVADAAGRFVLTIDINHQIRLIDQPILFSHFLQAFFTEQLN